MRRRIICGVDDSRGGREALIVAAALGTSLGRDLLSVHAVGGDTGEHDGAADATKRRELVDAAERMLERVAGSGGRDNRGARRVEVGNPAARLAAVAEEEEADFIVVGSRGRGRLRSALLGSVSRELLALAPCPVVVVPPGAAGAPGPAGGGSAGGQSIVCGIDETAGARVAAVAAAKLARQTKSRLVLVHAYRRRLSVPRRAVGERRAARSRLEVAAADVLAHVDADVSLERADPAIGISRAAAREAARLIVVGASTRGPVADLVTRSVGMVLAGSAPAPVLVVADRGWREVGPASGREVRPASVSRSRSRPRDRLRT